MFPADDLFSRYAQNYEGRKEVEMTLFEYLEACKKDPLIYATAAERILAAIGEAEVVDTAKDPRLGRIFMNRTIKVYPAFNDFYGMEETIERIVGFFRHAAQGLEERKQILYLLGPVGGGKSSLAERLKSLMERQPIYALKAGKDISPLFESPLGLFDPDQMGPVLEDKFGIPRRRLTGLMSPWAVKRLDEFGGDISKFRVVRLMPSKLRQIGVSKTEPGDENNQDISSLVGKVDIRKLEMFSQNDPDAYSFSGGLNRATQGILEFVEMFKAPIKMLHPLLTATQEGNYVGTENIGAMPFQGIILAHSNEAEWQTFKNNKNNEAFIDRIYVIKVPYCLRVTEEQRIYEKLVRGSELAAALLAAGFLGHRFIRRPVSALVEAAESWGTGDYRARVGLPDDRSEFGVLARAFDAMAEALERREKERDVAEDTARKMAAVLESSTDGICEIDRDWCISFINSRASAFIGPGREAVGTPLFEAFPEAAGSLVQRECGRAMAENVPVSFEEYFGAHDLWLSVRAFPVSSGLMICFQDVTARRRADQHGERTEAHHRAIVATAPEGMVVIDEHGVIQSFNPAAERLFGYEPGEVVGRNVTILMPERDRSVHDGYIWNYRHGAGRNVIGRGRELEGRRRDGSIFPLELSVAEWRDGRQRFFTGFMRDASARREAGDALKSARAEAAAARAEADRAALSKSRFLTAASHDLRQPVQSLLFLSAALAEGLRGHPMLPLAGSIDQATDALKRLLDGLLDISRLDAGAITPKATLFSADTLIGRLGAEYAQRAERQGVSLRVVGCSSRVHSDPVLLERILRNLIENALRHTTHGRILIGCRRISGALRIDVLDTGTGVPPDTFAQCPDGGQEAGLGLAIVRRLAALLGHRVSALYSPGHGSRYSVEVPLAALSAPERSPSAIAVEESARPGTRGLIVILDDEAIILLGLGVLLESWGYQVLSAMSLDEAVQQVADETRTPDLIIADYRLADGNTGPEAIDAIREISDPRIPGIVLTGDTAPGLLERVGKRGFGILHKPVAADDLHRIVLGYIDCGGVEVRGIGLSGSARQMPTSTAALTM